MLVFTRFYRAIELHAEDYRNPAVLGDRQDGVGGAPYGPCSAMLGVGFSNCRDEWWHYSYGDAGWAVRTGSSTCPYGLAQLPHELYEELERLHEEGMNDRTNPFLA